MPALLRERRGAAKLERGDEVELAAELLAELEMDSGITPVYDGGALWIYSPAEGLWRRADPLDLATRVGRYAGRTVEGEGKAQDRSLRLSHGTCCSSVRHAEGLAQERGFFDPEKQRPGVAFVSGFVEVVAGDLIRAAHSPHHRATFGLPLDFALGEAGEPSRLLAFLRETFAGCADVEERIALVQEYLGACVAGLAVAQQKALVLTGGGANGKSVLLDVARSLFPKEFRCSLQPHELSARTENYRLAELAGKRVNIAADLSATDLLDTGNLKAAIAGDELTGRRIREAPFQFTPAAGHLFAVNLLPSTSDHSDGFWRRFLVLDFPNIVPEEKRNPYLARELVGAEHEQIAEWALCGAARLLAQNSYTEPASARAARDEWRRRADPVRQFLDGRTMPPTRARLGDGHDRRATGAELYAAYRAWTQANGYAPLNLGNFGARVRALGCVPVHPGGVARYPVELRPESEGR